MNWFSRLLCTWFNIGCPQEPPVPETLPPSRDGIEFCYFGVQDGDIPQIKDHVTMVHIGSWGDWITPEGRADLTNRIVGYARLAVTNGITKLMLTLDFCCFTAGSPKHLLPLAQMQTYLIEFADRLRDENLLQYIHAFYVIDEPNIRENNLSASDVSGACAAIRDVFTHYFVPPPLAIIYGSGGFPGIESLDWAGFDNYGSPIFSNGEYQNLVDHLSAGQRTIIVPGGGSPWREDPKPFYMHAQSDPLVAMIMPFKWFDPDGIVTNGMAPVYRQVGQLIKATEDA